MIPGFISTISPFKLWYIHQESMAELLLIYFPFGHPSPDNRKSWQWHKETDSSNLGEDLKRMIEKLFLAVDLESSLDGKEEEMMEGQPRANGGDVC